MALKAKIPFEGVAFEYSEKDWKFEDRSGTTRILVVLTDDTYDKIECRVDESWMQDAKRAAEKRARVRVIVSVDLSETRCDVVEMAPPLVANGSPLTAPAAKS